VYRIVPDPSTLAQVEALPRAALVAYAEVLAALALAPWDGPPQHRDNADGAVRRWPFGPGAAGHVVYLVMEEQREVHLLLVQWLD
jgi:hypothetical protein